jgi:hypothetical protein
MWKKKHLYSHSRTEDDAWMIFVGTEPDCGINVCSVGYFEARRRLKPPRPEMVDEVVKLSKRIKGYYTGRSCGVSCTPPEISWVYEGVLYSIQFNVGSRSASKDRAALVEMANSAILNGPR